MNQNENIMKVAEISSEDIERINSCQAGIKTLNDKDVVLIAYEK